MNSVISFDMRADFGFLKKPDTNDPIYLTFNMLHKPALLGILGAIIGLGGFSEAKDKEEKQKPEKGKKRQPLLPEYYTELQDLKVGIKPLGDENGNFQKTTIKYNNAVGYANKDANDNGATLNIIEQTLIKPAYRCYLLLEETKELHQKLRDYLKNCKAEFLPYLGKNDFSVWWDNFQEYEVRTLEAINKSFKVNTIFKKEEMLKDGVLRSKGFKPKPTPNSKFMYFENLPVKYSSNLNLLQYDYAPFAYTDWDLQADYKVEGIYELTNKDGNKEIIQVF
jgi:CRISPR-associated protein Cas5h